MVKINVRNFLEKKNTNHIRLVGNNLTKLKSQFELLRLRQRKKMNKNS